MPKPYTLPPMKTMDDIDKVIDFIAARVKPLRDAAPFNSDQERAHQALLDMSMVLKGSAESVIDRGADPGMQHFYLVTAARQWNSHPDFQPEWNDA